MKWKGLGSMQQLTHFAQIKLHFPEDISYRKYSCFCHIHFQSLCKQEALRHYSDSKHSSFSLLQSTWCFHKNAPWHTRSKFQPSYIIMHSKHVTKSSCITASTKEALNTGTATNDKICRTLTKTKTNNIVHKAFNVVTNYQKGICKVTICTTDKEAIIFLVYAN